MSAEIREGDIIDGRFEVCKDKSVFPIKLYACFDRESKEIVLLESVHEKYLLTEQAKERFLEYAYDYIALGAHKNILRARSVTNIKGKPYLCLDYVSGWPSLHDYCAYEAYEFTWKKHKIEKSIRVALDICKGLEWVGKKRNGARHSYVHGNLATESILVTEDEVPKIFDFGLLHLLFDLGVTIKKNALFIKDGACGTPWCMSPEHWHGPHLIDERSDIYSFGCILYFLLTLQHPFSASRIPDCRQAHLTKTPPRPSELVEDIPEELDSLVMRCLEKRAEDRFSGFEQLRQELARVYEMIDGVAGREEGEEDVVAWEMAMKAVALTQFGKYKEAKEWCDKALSLSPSSLTALKAKAEVLSGMGDKQGALDCLHKALELDVQDVLTLSTLGSHLWDLEDLKGALHCFERALEIEPEHASSKICKGLCLIALGEYERARDFAKKVLEDPTIPSFAKSEMWRCLGNANWKLGNKKKALQCFKKARAASVFDGPAIIDKGYLLLELGKFEEALKCFQKGSLQSTDEDAAQMGIALVYAYQNRLQDAVETLRGAFNRFPELAKEWMKKAEEAEGPIKVLLWKVGGAALAKAHMFKEARDFLDKALELDPRDHELWRLRADLEGNMKRAIEYFDKAIALNPRDEQAWFRKGATYHGLGEGEKAIECFDKVLEINPNHAGAWFHKALTLDMLIDDLRQAISCYEKAIELRPNDYDFWVQKGIAHRSLEEYDKAIACFEKAIELDPNEDEAWWEKEETLSRFSDDIYEQGMKFLKEKDYEKAVQSFQIALDTYPYNKRARKALKKSHKKLAELYQAIEELDEVLKLSPTFDLAWNAKGCALLELRRSQDALECFERAIQANPSYALAWNNKGLVLAKRFQFDEALQCYERAIAIDPMCVEAWLNRGAALVCLARFEEAVYCYERAVEIKPRNPKAWFDLGTCLAAEKRFKEAVKAFERFFRLARSKKYAELVETAEKMMGPIQIYSLMEKDKKT